MSHSNLAERTSSKSVHVCQLIAERWLSGGMEKHVVEL